MVNYLHYNIDEIKTARCNAVISIVNMISDKVNQYTKYPSSNQCHFKEPGCDATSLGLLIRALKEVDIDAFNSMTLLVTTKSVNEIRQVLHTLRWPQYLPSCSYADSRTLGSTPCCTKPQWPANQPLVDIATHSVLCTSCRKLYSIHGSGGHAVKCSPLQKLQERADEVVEKIQGLEYSRFVGGKNKEHFSGTPAAGSNLWKTVLKA